jgi:hypothetical protein
MPFLDADALKTDPAGMAFLRSVIEPAAQGDHPAEATLGSAQRLRAAAPKRQRSRVSHARDRRIRVQAVC